MAIARAPVKSRHVLTSKPVAHITAKGNELMGGVLKAVMEGIETAGARKDTKISSTAVDSSKTVIRQEVKEAVAASPEFQHITNSEPFWRKRSFWSTVASVGTATGAAAIYVADRVATGEASELTLGLVVSALLAGWGSFRAGTATRPLGS